jgi:uncharacterized protein with FMN-binding domain
MEIEPIKRSNLPIKLGAGILIILIYLGVTMYLKHTRDAKVEDTADANSNTTITEQTNAAPAANVPAKTPAANNASPANNTPTINTPTNTNTPPPAATAFKNGTYTASGSYTSPGGQEQITVTVTLANDKITATQAETKAASPTSKQYQSEFINNYKPLVVGKSIADLKLNKVAGSSLTSKGFNDAISKIKTQAQS